MPSSTISAVRADRQVGMASSSLAEEMLTMNQSHRMHEQTLLDRFVELEIREPDFGALLSQEMQLQLERKRPSIISILAQRHFGSRFWSTTTLLLASFATLFWFHPWLSDTRLVIQSAISIPLLGMLPASISGMAAQSLRTLTFEVAALLQLFLTPEMVKYVQETLLPVFWNSFQKMLLMDAWRRFWREVGKLYKRVVGSQFPSSNSSLLDDEAVAELMTPWVRAPLLYLEQVVRRGTRSIVKSSFQRNVQRRIRLAVEGTIQMLITGDASGDAKGPIAGALVAKTG